VDAEILTGVSGEEGLRRKSPDQGFKAKAKKKYRRRTGSGLYAANRKCQASISFQKKQASCS
jgi:hypothetical protein